ncbi:hypothetical protein QWA68_013008 [Fusarium oxysporum]|nr:hypothetical protein QWA68_013008 [Fusarium oxysporum]
MSAALFLKLPHVFSLQLRRCEVFRLFRFLSYPPSLPSSVRCNAESSDLAALSTNGSTFSCHESPPSGTTSQSLIASSPSQNDDFILSSMLGLAQGQAPPE